MKKVSVSVPGKCILFGEHAVVYGFPAIVMAIDLNSRCKIQQVEGDKSFFVLENFDEKYEFSSISEFQYQLDEDFNQFVFCLNYFSTRYNVSFDGISIALSSEIPQGAGLGSSASISVALISALSEFYEISLEKQEISEFAFQMEEITHGRPSGIDNTICAYGGVLRFQKGEFRDIEIPDSFEVLITNTNVSHNTKSAVIGIRDMRIVQPDFVSGVFERIGICSELAEKSLKTGTLKEIGDLMNINQTLLSSLHLSSEEITDIVETSLKNGASGSKLTGAGLGGCVITVGEKSNLDEIRKILNEKDYDSFYSKVNRKGIEIKTES